MSKPSTQIQLKPSPKSVLTTAKAQPEEPKKTATAEIHASKTSPTLVEFQNRNAELPDWRLHLKNAVQKRLGKTGESSETIAMIEGVRETTAKAYPVSGGNALKAEIIEDSRPTHSGNAQLANALQRIERSRQKYHVVESEPVAEVPEPAKPAKDYPFKIAARNDNPVPETPPEQNISVNFPNKPQLVPQPIQQKSKDLYDTSELDPHFIPAKISSSFEKRPTLEKRAEPAEKKVSAAKPAENEVIQENPVVQPSEIDDLAPFALRFNAGVFDLLVGSFASLILLSPFVLLGGSWFSLAGLLAFSATGAVVMFVYLTTTLGFFGKSFGMHLFSLEMIDYNTDEYPTFHQSAVNSSIYLLSLAFCGLGFVTSVFDEDRRAVHDLVAGTIVVKEI
jgi:uncharacterized RDD family membrane protein YckC